MDNYNFTKGKWRKFQLPNGNMKITCDDWREFAEIEFKHWQNTEERRKQCLYNALLISKAPEMLEMLIKLKDAMLELIEHQDGWEEDYEELTENIKGSVSKKIYILATYTAMINYRKYLHSKGYINKLW